MEGDIGTRNAIFNQLSNSWTMYWYLFTLETFWVINLGFVWMCDVAITKKSKVSENVLFREYNAHVSFQTVM